MPQPEGRLPALALAAGARIFNTMAGRAGTLGCIGLDPDGAPWIVSCYHVLGRRPDSIDYPRSGEPIWHTSPDRGGTVIATVSLSRMNSLREDAAACVVPGIAISRRLLGIGELSGVGRAAPGMLVAKHGSGTGVTWGIVSEVDDAYITVDAPPDLPDDQLICDRGDCGAVWVDTTTGLGVAMHVAAKHGRRTYARPLAKVLANLELTLLTEDR